MNELLRKDQLQNRIKKLKEKDISEILYTRNDDIIIVAIRISEPEPKPKATILQCYKCRNIIDKPRRGGVLLCDDCYKIKRSEDMKENAKRQRENKKKHQIDTFGVEQ